ncbi:cytochrome b [Chachezhania sediminis]|uniref:cytochrome b n=1 Tax=Chachezhania sediminis TaxID=2599291 RepID=UPI00131C44F1|nr:cytochrome b/b6 domain-containing protein [Chachezhania sediminis]
MGLSKKSAAFTPVQKALHWAVVVLLGFQFFVFDGMGRPFHQLMDGVATYTTTVIAHIAIGLAVLVFALWRLVLRARHGAPAAPEAEPEALRKVSKLAHAAIYLLMLVLPVTGLIAWFGKVGNVAEVHEVLTNALLALVILHVAAVAVHQFWWKTNLLARMR